MTAANIPIVPMIGNEPPVDTVLREVTPAGPAHIWYRRDGHWTCTHLAGQVHWPDVCAAARAGSTFTVLYLPATGGQS